MTEQQPLLTRTFAPVADLEVKGDGRTLVLAVLPWMTPAEVADASRPRPYREQFQRGAFSQVVKAPNRVELRYWHDQTSLPYGFGAALSEDGPYLRGDFRVAKGVAGDQLLALVDDGLKGVSVGYYNDPAGDRWDGDLVTRTKVLRLKEVSMTPAPTWTEAEVLAVRSEGVAGSGPMNLDALLERERHFWAKVASAC